MNATANLSAPVGPTESTARLVAMDVARGFALLGILFVNIQAFAEPFGRFVSPVPEGPGALTAACFYFVKIFCEGKFYPLFSMLFGMGLVLQMRSVTGRGGNFYAVYIRRLLWLFLMGLSHALLLWYGDILFVYSIAGVALMLLARLSPRVLLGIGVGLVLFGTVLQAGFTALTLAAPQPADRAERAAATTGATPPADAGRTDSAEVNEPTTDAPAETEVAATEPAREPLTPFMRLMEGFRTGAVQQPDSPIWMEAETEATRDGPFLQAFLFRVFSWLMYMFVCVFGFGWHVLGMFCIGAGLLGMGLLSPRGASWQTRFIVLGLLVGVPACVLGAALPGVAGVSWWTMGLYSVVQMTCGPLLSLMYLCTAATLVRTGALATVTGVLASVGRMALTNYIMHTLVATFIFYHWGLAQFGSWSRPERCALVLAIFAAQCVISPLWLSVFRFGPLEWVWRSVTYLRPQPLLRGGARADAAAP